MDSRNAALHRLLVDAQQGGQAKVDALLALAQRTVFVVPWPNPADGYRTLVNSNGLAALPIFTEASILHSAAERFGWLDATGRVAQAEIGSRQAFTFARDRGLAFVVVDIAAEHSLEIAALELEPLLSPAARRESQGPFAGAGRISSTLLQSLQQSGATRSATPPPGTIPVAKRTPHPGTLAQRPQVQPPPPGSSPGTIPAVTEPRSRSAGSSPGMIAVANASGPPSPMLGPERLMPLRQAIDPMQLDMLELVLREYPEVEWACFGLTQRGLAIGLRVDARVRNRVDDLAREVGRVSNGTPVMLLDDPQLMRAARTEAFVFFPWRKKS